ncbi:hypothetical protein [Ramlibacter humi]|uniref:Lipoprotein n=1 Tax=Ramlibacter humi TaxID=2530451 RepID=A0A4Z0BMN3_9BURK|nr:hypothetical protein [Ramlibacter humi]TFZ00091.1 hypothetical protein EZ216_13350 [Ramlibacter humi]
MRTNLKLVAFLFAGLLAGCVTPHPQGLTQEQELTVQSLCAETVVALRNKQYGNEYERDGAIEWLGKLSKLVAELSPPEQQRYNLCVLEGMKTSNQQ